jgi:flagellar motor component MotA
MNTEEFIKEYKEIVERAILMAEKSRREGLLALDDLIDETKIYQRDIFEVGMRLVTDGVDASLINDVLTNIINLEKDSDKKVLLNIKKEAVLQIQEGCNPRVFVLMLNSYVDIEVEEAMKRYMAYLSGY